RGGRLVEVGHRPGLQGADPVLVLGVLRQHHHPDPAAGLVERLQHLEPAAPGQVDVQHEHVRLDGAQQLPQLGVVGRLADDLEAARLHERLAHAPAHELMVVDEDDPDHAVPPPSGRVSRTVQPRPPPLPATSSQPPTRRARSVSPRMPKEPSLSRSASVSPTPSSLTSRDSSSSATTRSTRTDRACACLRTFVSASCSVRYTTMATCSSSSIVST